MGMFDTIEYKTKCPICRLGELSDFQTKSFQRLLRRIIVGKDIFYQPQSTAKITIWGTKEDIKKYSNCKIEMHDICSKCEHYVRIEAKVVNRILTVPKPIKVIGDKSSLKIWKERRAKLKEIKKL